MKESKLYIETYGCQMNLSDSEIITGIMKANGYEIVTTLEEANIILFNTCSVREHAEERVIQRIRSIKKIKQNHIIFGLIGCMAERLKEKIFNIEKSIDLILGPDNYRKLPEYIKQIEQQKKLCDTTFQHEETYSDIIPSRESDVIAWIPIMRGCDNHCSYCIVPLTRGKERSRDFNSIIDEAKKLISENYKELYLLGQNVNSYNYDGKNFSDILESVAKLNRDVRIRFMTSHPKDLSNDLIETISRHHNICKYIHLPCQSGSNRILKIMNRKYTREQYLELIKKIKNAIPEVSLSTDVIVGFPSETEADFLDTLNLLSEVKFDSAFMFKYSPREGTAAYLLNDDVPENVKSERLSKVIDLQQNISSSSNQNLIGTSQEVLIESYSKKSESEFQGRLGNNKVVVFPAHKNKIGETTKIKITRSTSATLIGELV
jgi:tRNA-2-methylthio-N6-dimethylallyladenosine synthase